MLSPSTGWTLGGDSPLGSHPLYTALRNGAGGSVASVVGARASPDCARRTAQGLVPKITLKPDAAGPAPFAGASCRRSSGCDREGVPEAPPSEGAARREGCMPTARPFRLGVRGPDASRRCYSTG